MTKKPNQKSKRLPPDDERARIIRELEAKVASLKEELRQRNLEASFLESALRKVEAIRRRTNVAGLAGLAPPTPPDMDGLSYQSGVIEGKAARQRLESKK